jgi:Major Facilitator Superfamily
VKSEQTRDSSVGTNLPFSNHEQSDSYLPLRGNSSRYSIDALIVFAPRTEVLLTIYPKERQGFAMALFGIGVVVGPVLGPVLGGWLTENYSWRYVFYINGPLGIIDLVGLIVFLPKSR